MQNFHYHFLARRFFRINLRHFLWTLLLAQASIGITSKGASACFSCMCTCDKAERSDSIPLMNLENKLRRSENKIDKRRPKPKTVVTTQPHPTTMTSSTANSSSSGTSYSGRKLGGAYNNSFYGSWGVEGTGSYGARRGWW